MNDPQAHTATDEKGVEKATTILLKEPEIMYCQATLLHMSREESVLSFISGEVAAARFAFSYPHLKRLRNILDKNLKIYESKYGTITEDKDVTPIPE